MNIHPSQFTIGSLFLFGGGVNCKEHRALLSEEEAAVEFYAPLSSTEGPMVIGAGRGK